MGSNTVFVIDPETAALFSVFAFDYIEEQTLDEEADTWLERKETRPGSVRRENIVISGQPALRVEYVRTDRTCIEREEVVFVPYGLNQLFILMGTDCLDHADFSRPTFQAMQNSFILPD